jgi:hypothetical protein
LALASGDRGLLRENATMHSRFVVQSSSRMAAVGLPSARQLPSSTILTGAQFHITVEESDRIADTTFFEIPAMNACLHLLPLLGLSGLTP